VEVIGMTEDLVESHTGADGMGQSGRGAKAEIEHEDEQPSAPEIVDDSVSGALCQVRSGGGGGDSWCDAVMVGVLSNGQIRVVMGGGEDEDGEPSVEDVDADCVRDAEDGTIPIDSRAGLESKDEDVYEGDDDDDNFDIALDDAKNQSKDGNTREVYRGVPAPKRFKATETVSVSKKTLPEKFLVRDGDDEVSIFPSTTFRLPVCPYSFQKGLFPLTVYSYTLRETDTFLLISRRSGTGNGNKPRRLRVNNA
jgi:hypothetical protein